MTDEGRLLIRRRSSHSATASQTTALRVFAGLAYSEIKPLDHFVTQMNAEIHVCDITVIANYRSMYGIATVQSCAEPQGAALLRVDPSLALRLTDGKTL
jgi:hypothetical protein